ncbi:hypothetical protein QAD02_008023 [Eretmocerus hayati]|uniref:Uncharacterized protein n=1 Tax=Eretmocerus hayati TaxID=131215 RepID=A0ACC2N648_9HYME|nr:hypothetical protein QAD02_008023 [Eretmocerus hayati]
MSGARHLAKGSPRNTARKPIGESIKIKVGPDKIVHHNISQGCMELQKFRLLYPGVTTLCYEISQDTVKNLDFDDNFIYFEGTEHTYQLVKPHAEGRLDVYFASPSTPKKCQRSHLQEEIVKCTKFDKTYNISKLKVPGEPAHKKMKALPTALSNKSQEIQGEKVSVADPRIIRIHWLNKNDPSLPTFVSMGNSLGAIKKSSLDKNQNYSLEQLKETLVEKYVTDANRLYFESSAIVYVGYCSDKQVQTINSFGEDDVDFWDVCDKFFKRSNREIHIYLLTVQTVPIFSDSCEQASSQDLETNPNSKTIGIKRAENDEMANFFDQLEREDYENSQCALPPNQETHQGASELQSLHQSIAISPTRKVMSELQNSPSKDATSVFAQPALLRKRSAHNSDICRAKKQSIPPLSSSKLDFDTLPEGDYLLHLLICLLKAYPHVSLRSSFDLLGYRLAKFGCLPECLILGVTDAQALHYSTEVFNQLSMTIFPRS